MHVTMRRSVSYPCPFQMLHHQMVTSARVSFTPLLLLCIAPTKSYCDNVVKCDEGLIAEAGLVSTPRRSTTVQQEYPCLPGTFVWQSHGLEEANDESEKVHTTSEGRT